MIKNKVRRETKPLVRLTPKQNIDDLSSGVIRITHKQIGTSNSSIRSGLEQNCFSNFLKRLQGANVGQGMLTIRAASSGLQNEKLRLIHVDGGKNSFGTLFSINAEKMKASTAVKIDGKGVLLKVHSKRHKYNHSIVSMSAIQNVMRISYSSPGSTNNIRVLQIKQSRGSLKVLWDPVVAHLQYLRMNKSQRTTSTSCGFKMECTTSKGVQNGTLMSIIRKSSSELSGSLLNLVAADGSFGNVASSFVGNSGRTVLTLHVIFPME